jgi:hypothetical protein
MKSTVIEVPPLTLWYRESAAILGVAIVFSPLKLAVTKICGAWKPRPVALL